jgi:hypothetical protein
MKRIAPLLFLLFSLPARADDLAVSGNQVKTYTVVSGFPATITAPKGASWYKWYLPPTLTAKPSTTNVLEVTGGAAGQYAVSCDATYIDFKAQTFSVQTYAASFSIGDVPPGPDPGPGPGPDPLPMGAQAAGLRVFVCYESAELSKLPPAQALILTSATVRDYLNSHCLTEPDGKTKAYRLWDKDVQGAENDLKVWAGALKRPHASLPWLTVSNGRTWYDGPLLADVDGFLNLVKKYEAK